MHIMQSKEWGKVRSLYGNQVRSAGGVQYSKHKIPLLNKFYAYAPKVDPLEINWEELQNSLIENNCINVNLDIPNVVKGTKQEKASEDVLQMHAIKAPRNTFTKYNVILDITPPKEELLDNMHKKHKYNIGYAKRNGVTVKQAETFKDFETFYDLLVNTSRRQKFYIHNKVFFETIWKNLKPLDIVHILIAYKDKAPIAAWMLYTYKGVLYYPYGGSDDKYKNLQASTLLGWESILLGKEKNCKTFDMWGVGNIEEDDSWGKGFTTFKLRYGGKYVEYLDSYDYVINPTLYKVFNITNKIRWKILRFIK
ncbi:peptidoglycan bridge formation glycyltransferase FemA/FemB family protein [candidate division WWE3 bacterium]|uniref:Peptidoglycan bridge formation glycyltransferase FemA/FemB family protein n=1 Tax=candidate division WWE3 bacterium TaxID=2053526 RepID=A0A955ECX0_UNCKA|nr:peptidoglycan bridge formation glycyltransferase FemA/FemB family protein [candidate division WWE3 bacterium]